MAFGGGHYNCPYSVLLYCLITVGASVPLSQLSHDNHLETGLMKIGNTVTSLHNNISFTQLSRFVPQVYVYNGSTFSFDPHTKSVSHYLLRMIGGDV